MNLKRASKPMHSQNVGIAGSSAFEEMARANLLRLTPFKWRLVRVFEALMRLLKPFTPPLRPFENPKEQPASILVIEYWNLGDLAILVPFLRNLRQSFPRARISLLVKANLTYVLDHEGLVDAFIPARVPWAQHFNRWRKYNPFSLDWISLARTILLLRKRRFDWAFSGRMDVRDNFLLWLIGARRRIGYGIAGGGNFLTDRIMPDIARPHRADVWLHMLDAIGLPVDRKPVSLRLADAELAAVQSHFMSLGIPSDTFLIGIHPGSRIATRRWGDERFAEVVSRILKNTNAHVLWFSELGRSGDAPSLERCHELNVSSRPFLAALSKCRLLLCNDSGPMHLANLLSVPVVAVFGPTNPLWFGPRGTRDRVVIRPEFWCRPCLDYCLFDQPYCLRAISVDDVYEAVQQQISEIRQSGHSALRRVRSFESISYVP